MYKYIHLLFLMLIIGCHNDRVEKEYLVSQEIILDGNMDILPQIYNPYNILIVNSNIYILDKIQMKIIVCTQEGNYITEMGGPGEAPGQFSQMYFAIDSDEYVNIYTVDAPNRILVFSNSGEYKRTIQTQIPSIFDMTVYNSNRIYINENTALNSSDNYLVSLIDSTGSRIMQYCPVTISDNINEPWKITFYRSCAIDNDDNGNLYIARLTDYSIYKYNISGELIYEIQQEMESAIFAYAGVKFPLSPDLSFQYSPEICFQLNRSYVSSRAI
jgi:hypothetical protein